METKNSASASILVLKLKPIDATPESFKEFGQVCEASTDGGKFGPQDAQLDLTRGIPRFSIMHLENQPLKFQTITHHANVTQCLGSIGAHVWYLGVSKPSILDSDHNKSEKIIRTSKSGHLYEPPKVDDVRVFRIAGPKFIKLNRGTWHDGPLFKETQMDFYNLELTNTYVRFCILFIWIVSRISLSAFLRLIYIVGMDFFLNTPLTSRHISKVASWVTGYSGNEVDFTTHSFIKDDRVVFVIDD
ncbi:hypothetical protein ACFE04_016752 [Oxalis oulophora]